MRTTANAGAADAASRHNPRLDGRQAIPSLTAGVEPWLVGGAGLYWASVILQYLVPSRVPGTSLAFADLAVRYLILVGFLCIGLASARAFRSVRGRQALSIAAAVAALLTCFGFPDTADGGATAWDWVRLVLHQCAIASLMVLWGFAFASMDKRQAGQNVGAAVLVAACLVLAFLALAPAVPTALSSRIGMAGSALVVACGRIRFADRHRERAEGWRAPLGVFVLSRIAFGAFMGFCAAGPFGLASADISATLLGMGFIALGAALWAFGRAGALYAALPALLFLAIGIIYLPFFEGGLDTAAGAAGGAVWLAWAAFSAFQLSDLKERCGMGELALCLAEKLVLALAIVAGIVGYRILEELFPAACEPAALRYAIFAGTFACVLGSASTMARLVNARKEDELRDELARTRAERTEAALRRLADEFGLSARESEVLGMLADGYTRTYIRAALGISDGTARAHIAHVYQKLDVHRKDDLLALVDRRLGEG